MESSKASGVGNLLKGEREKKGFDVDQLSQVTRLRRHYIEALENENWDNLPSPVYVKGFIRSYAQGLGFDAREAISLYESATRAEEGVPKPLTELKDPRSKAAYLVIPILVILILGIYILLDYKDFFLSDIPVTSKEERPAPATEMAVTSTGQGHEYSAGAKEKPAEMPPVDNPVQATPVEEAALNQSAGPSKSIVNYSIPVSPGAAELVLTGIVNMSTYIKIYVDDNVPKEFIFQPGSRPRWEASKGFFIIVGNAAGIEFDFNGKRLTDLGPPGRVIRIRMPEDFQPEVNGNQIE